MMFFPFDTECYKAMVFFDTETSGLDYKHGQITQFAARKALPNGLVSQTNHYVQIRDDVEYSEEVQNLTSLSKKFLSETGVLEKSLAQSVFDFLFSVQPVVLIAHNAPFDMLFILELLKRYGLCL
jgi:DNA polymerase-3 subunit epsilon